MDQNDILPGELSVGAGSHQPQDQSRNKTFYWHIHLTSSLLINFVVIRFSRFSLHASKLSQKFQTLAGLLVDIRYIIVLIECIAVDLISLLGHVAMLGCEFRR